MEINYEKLVEINYEKLTIFYLPFTFGLNFGEIRPTDCASRACSPPYTRTHVPPVPESKLVLLVAVTRARHLHEAAINDNPL